MKENQRLLKVVDMLAGNRKIQPKDIELRLNQELSKLVEELSK
jgi:hypothetical protein